ncbi:Gfo/Idh/MocA family oxidoreductase [Arthrobacter sp. H5]|uniref:Gfo/Idh/MocA family protein n=1 Tax=Arthrobacter sp. H5 TaxID=1267973 RepID=UPI0004B70396|nr:Gfo/Idh/MocA family oxidoreductase [Arthrobacter sp. H5]
MSTAEANTIQRAVIVGCGVIGRQHAEVLASLRGAEVVAVVDAVHGAAVAIADKLEREWNRPRPAVFTTLKEALAAQDADLVAVCTPSGLHAPVAEEAIAAGKHVVIEKPLDVDLARARTIAAAADRAKDAGLVVSVISQHRFDPSSLAVARAVQDGRFGRLTSGVASVAWWRSQRYYDSGEWRGTWDLDGGGAVMNQGVHTVDLLIWFLGRPVEIHAHTALLAHERMEVEDTAVATIRFASGALGVVHATTAAYPGLTVRVQVHGSEGSAVIDNDELTYFHALDASRERSDMGLNLRGNQAQAELGDAGANFPAQDPTVDSNGHTRQYKDILEAIAEGRQPGVTVGDAVMALATVRALYISAALGAPVKFDDVLAGNHDHQLVAMGGTS